MAEEFKSEEELREESFEETAREANEEADEVRQEGAQDEPCEENREPSGGAGDPFPGMAEDLKKILKAGIGALAGAVEKTVQYAQDLATDGTEANRQMNQAFDTMARKGEEALRSTQAFGNDVKNRIVNAVNSIPVGYENIMNSLDALTEEQLETLRDKSARILAGRAAQAQAEAEAAAKAAQEEEEKQPDDVAEI